MRCLADAAVAAASVDQRKVLDLLARRVGRHRRCGLLGRRSPRCDEGHGRRQAQGGRRESDSEDTGDFAHENLHQAAGRVPGGIWGVISHGRDERLEGEVELIWISLESFWRFSENGMMGPLFGVPAAQKLQKPKVGRSYRTTRNRFEQQRATEILTSAAAKRTGNKTSSNRRPHPANPGRHRWSRRTHDPEALARLCAARRDKCGQITCASSSPGSRRSW